MEPPRPLRVSFNSVQMFDSSVDYYCPGGAYLLPPPVERAGSTLGLPVLFVGHQCQSPLVGGEDLSSVLGFAPQPEVFGALIARILIQILWNIDDYQVIRFAK